MTFGVLGELNWLAVVVAALAYFALGGLWYMPRVFGDIWARSIGWDATGEDGPGPAFYLGPFVTCALATIAVAMLARASDTDTFAEGVVLGLVTGVGVAGAVLLVTGYFDPKKPKPMAWFGVTAGYHLVGLLIAAVIVSVWT
jgi:Protein of unknown function (DUF1761)